MLQKSLVRGLGIFGFVLSLASSVEPMDRAGEAGGNFLSQFPQDAIVSGGPGKDGIPALTDPAFIDPGHIDAGYLKDEDLVLGVAINGEARAYPHNIGWWHEIVNDVVGGQPIVVSFCPLTGTGMVFNGLGPTGDRITAGVSGLLFNNNLIMYDRRDNRTLYPQMISRGVQGPREGEELILMPVVETTWEFWKQLYPHTKVISGRTGVYNQKQYEFYPYTGGGSDYRTDDTYILFQSTPLPGDNPTSGIYGAKAVTLGVRFGEISTAYPFAGMGDRAVINDQVAGQDIVVLWWSDARLALPFFRTVDGRTLTFVMEEREEGIYPFLLRDVETGTLWDFKGEGISGPLEGKKLTQAPAHNAFWFAWATFWQNTGIKTSDTLATSDIPESLASPADFNGDGAVDFSDFVEFAKNFGLADEDAEFDSSFDLEENGKVDFSDFVAFARDFGQ